MDFAIALLLFTFTLVVYFSYTNNIQKQEQGKVEIMLKDAKSISNSLALGGYPDDWNNLTVIRIGVTDDQNLNSTKLKTFKKLNYTLARQKFATPYDYFVYFANEKGEVLNINSICGTGYPLINTTYSIKSAYYYQDPADSFLLSFMQDAFKADIYFGDNPGNDKDIDALVANLSKYQFLVLEHPLMSGGDFNNFKDSFNNYSSRGGLFMISGELASPSTNTMVGADFKKKSGQSSSQRTAIVNNTDEYLSLTVGQSMVFSQYYYVENASEAIGFKRIATFNQSGDNAVSKWKYGNGTVYFFSDFDVSAFGGDFVSMVEDATQSLVQGTCNPINFTNAIQPKDLVKIERYLSYNSRLIKMIVYVWE